MLQSPGGKVKSTAPQPGPGPARPGRRYDPKPAPADIPALPVIPGLSDYCAARLPADDIARILLLPEAERETRGRWFLRYPDVPGSVFDRAAATAAEVRNGYDTLQNSPATNGTNGRNKP